MIKSRTTIARFTLGFVGLLAIAVSVQAATVPFSDTFNYADGSSLDSVNGWGVSGSGSAIATNNTAEIVDAILTNNFTDAQTDVWTDMLLKPVFGDGTTTNVPSGSAYAFYVSVSSNVVAYNGTSTQILSTVVTEGAWTRFTVHADYGASTWDLYVDGALAAAGLNFYDGGVSDLENFGVVAEGVATTTSLDNVYITLSPSNAIQPEVNFAAASLGVDEDIGVATGTVELAWAYAGTAEVDVVVFGGTATSGPDFGYTNLTVSFDPAETSKDFTFLINDDTIGEPAETIFFGFDNFSESSAGSQTNFTTTINVDPIDVPLVEFSSASVSYSEADGLQTVTVELSAVNSLGTATVHHVVLPAGTTATDPTDYTYTPGMISFDPGETNKTFSFTIQNDTEGEGPETIVFGLKHFTNSLPGAVTNLTVTIEEDPNDWTLPFVETFEARTIGDLNGQYGWIAQDAEVQAVHAYAGSQAGSITSTTGYARHTFADAQTDVWTEIYIQPVFDGGSTTNPPAGSSFAFYVDENADVVVYNGTATQIVDTAVVENAWTHFAVHSDYANTNWDLYLDGALIAEDLDFYDSGATAYSEFGLIAGAGASNAPIDNVSITVMPPSSVQPEASFALAATNYTEDAGVVTGYVNLAWSYGGTAEVDVVVVGGTAGGLDYGLPAQTLQFNPGETSKSFTLTITNDVISEPAETIILGLANYDECSAGDPTNRTVTIDVDPLDSAIPDIHFDIAALAVAESVGTVTATVRLDSSYSGTVTVFHAVSAASTATDVDDYTYTSGMLTFLPGSQVETFDFTIVDDLDNETAETIVFTLLNITNGAPVAPTNFTVTIGEDNGDWSLPFAEPFETLSPGDLNDQRGWIAEDGIVQSAPTYAGTKSGGITSSTGRAYHLFGDAQTEVWTELYIQPVFDEGTISNAPAGSSTAFFVNGDGDVVVFNGTATQTVATAISPDTWVNFIVHSDYGTKTWDLYLEGSIIASGLDFYDAGATAFTEFGLEQGGGASNAPVDNISIDTLRPASLPPQVSFDVATASYAENAGTVTGTVQLSWSSASAVTADVVVVTGGTAGGGDHTFTTTTLSFAPGITNQTFAFDITDDASPEPDETLILGLANYITGLPGVITNHTITIESDASDWTLPFFETFESRTLGDLNGQQGWAAQDGVVQGTTTYDGSSQAGSVTSATGFASHPFGDAQSEVWTDFYMQPGFGDSAPTNVPAGSSFVFYVNTSGNVVAYDGTNGVELTDVTLSAATWVRFTVNSHYATKTWDLYINGLVPAAASGFDFYDNSASGYSEFGWLGDGSGDVTPMDDLAITLTRPAYYARTMFMFR